MAPTHENPHKDAPHEKEHHGFKRGRPASGETEQLVFTIDVKTGGVVKIEKIDPLGKRREIAKDETVALAEKGGIHEIEAALDEAFEAGISSVLEPHGDDESDGASTASEGEEDLELRKLLLSGLVSRHVRRRLQRRLVQRLILSQTLAH
jgi:hypothetical protein